MDRHRPIARKSIRLWRIEKALSNRVFKSFDDIVDHGCDAWYKLIDQPWKITSIGLRDWAYRL